jgi:hypothetical protein
VLYDLARRFQDPKAQGVADWMKNTLGQVNAEEWWSLIWRDGQLRSAPIASLPSWHRFPDIDVVFWRSDWTAKATAIAFKCGPPEGHETTELVKKYPDWHLEDGHVHPDVNSFILFAHGKYLTGDSGYAGVPHTADHNTLLINGEGQGHEGTHDAWMGMPYAQLNQIHLVRTEMSRAGFTFVGEGAPAYDSSLGLTRYRRTLRVRDGRLEVSDEISDSRSVTFTELLHSDTKILQIAKDQFAIVSAPAELQIRLMAPEDAATRIEPNIVMGPGRPGSVDKGTPEQRGTRLAARTPMAANSAKFDWLLSF